ncbi:hypothetical protein LZ32DRAFT_434527 [Colletotrichum eremochloae]|nr:hypothetical protein LZ32DRAFT_434527 [Colletotrichum eremochloae]
MHASTTCSEWCFTAKGRGGEGVEQEVRCFEVRTQAHGYVPYVLWVVYCICAVPTCPSRWPVLSLPGAILQLETRRLGDALKLRYRRTNNISPKTFWSLYNPKSYIKYFELDTAWFRAGIACRADPSGSSFRALVRTPEPSSADGRHKVDIADAMILDSQNLFTWDVVRGRREGRRLSSSLAPFTTRTVRYEWHPGQRPRFCMSYHPRVFDEQRLSVLQCIIGNAAARSFVCPSVRARGGGFSLLASPIQPRLA